MEEMEAQAKIEIQMAEISIQPSVSQKALENQDSQRCEELKIEEPKKLGTDRSELNLECMMKIQQVFLKGMEEFHEQFEKRMDDKSREHQQQMEKLQGEFEKRMDDKNREHQQEMEKIQGGFEARMSKLSADHQENMNVILSAKEEKLKKYKAETNQTLQKEDDTLGRVLKAIESLKLKMEGLELKIEDLELITTSNYELLIRKDLEKILAQKYEWMVDKKLRPFQFYRDQEDIDVRKGFRAIEKLKKTDYGMHVASLGLERKLGTNPPSIQLTYWIRDKDNCGVIEGTMSNLMRNPQALKAKLLQLERQIVFVAGYSKLRPRYVGFVSPSFSGNPTRDCLFIRKFIVDNLLKDVVPNILSYLDEHHFHAINIGCLPELP